MTPWSAVERQKETGIPDSCQPCLVGCGSATKSGSAADWSVRGGTDQLVIDRATAESALPTAADLGAGWGGIPAGRPAIPLCMHDVDDKAVFAPDGEGREFTETALEGP
ncbi:hypothetical protein [Actinoallomurus rhizosphaericola]|uniref:hypothetical protein n=1 Tax=Actinoallomurus rhizosphaericola TaxID=2952536 RepID=UPI002093F0E1|nr:hypothetical protein [Actinoallomurus rhizosphaericola]MCO5999833.1 hypothetical protein [Actinoallomurus rhizosphaericola]